MPMVMVVLRSDFMGEIIPAAHFFKDMDTAGAFLVDCATYYDDLTDIQVYGLGDDGIYRLVSREVKSHA